MKNLTIEKFIEIFSGKWNEGGVCPKCSIPIHNPLKNFTDSYIDLGITGNDELTKVCKEYQETVQKLEILIYEIDFKFKEMENKNGI